MAARPFNEKDLITQVNGEPTFLGALVSTGGAVNNATTATPFSTPGLGPTGSVDVPQNLAGTLAGKTLLIQTSASGLILPSQSPSMVAAQGNNIIAQQTVLPPVQNTVPGVVLQTAERVVVIMGSNSGWLQWLPTSGSANCLVWELK